MNDFERKLRDTPLRQPPPELRDQILGPLNAMDAAANDRTPRTSSASSPRRRIGKTDESPARAKAHPLLTFLLKPASMFFIFVALVMTCGAALFVGANSAGKSAWDRYSDEARARGVKMSLKELLPTPVPDAENFAAVPLFANLFSEDEAVRKKAADMLALPATERASRFANLGAATRCDLAGWQADFVQSGDLTTVGAEPATDVLRAVENRFAPALAELAEAERRPGAVFPVKWEDGFAAQLPHLRLMQSAAKIHALRMSAHLARQNSAEAYGEFRGLMRLYHALEKEPTLIEGLVRVSILQLGCGGVWEGVVTSSWDARTLQKIEADLAAINVLQDALFAFSSERAGMNDVLETARMGKSPFAGAEVGFGLDPTRQMFLRAVPRIPGWISLNQTAMNRYHDQFPMRIDVAGERFINTGTTTAELDDIDRSILKQHIYVLYRLMIPAIATVETKFLHTHTAWHRSPRGCHLRGRRPSDG